MAKIEKVEILVFKPAANSFGRAREEVRAVRPSSIYPDVDSFKLKGATGAVVVKITTEDGLYGYGSTGMGASYRGSCEIMSDAMRPFLADDVDADRIEYIWDLCYKATVAIGRKGLAIHAISAIDIALWDLKGKKLGLPVYQLLGGKVRNRIKVYASGYDAELYRQLGFMANKIPMPCGPIDGKEGMKRNVSLVESAAKIMGGDTEIMLDCGMGWDAEYTIKIARMLKGFNIRWIEEPFTATDYEGFRRIRDILNPMGILVCAGEHEFTRWGARELVENKCVDILQCDINRCGGISEMRKISALCKANNVMLVPHAHGMPQSHFSISSLKSPFAEILPGSEDNPLFLGVPGVKDGYLEIPEGISGMGYELNLDYSNYTMM